MPTIKRTNVEAMNAAPNAHRNLTKAEKTHIAQAVALNPAMTKPQVTALARSMSRSPKAIQHAIEKARGAFMGSAEDIVRLHRKGIEDGINAGPDTKGYGEAMRQAQWVITQMVDGGVRIVERDSDGNASGNKIFVGINLGGKNEKAIEASSDE